MVQYCPVLVLYDYHTVYMYVLYVTVDCRLYIHYTDADKDDEHRGDKDGDSDQR